MVKSLLLLLLSSVVCMVSLAQPAEPDYLYNMGTGFNGAVNASALQADGKLVVGGAFTSYNGTTRNYIARLNTDGTLDLTFDPGSGLNGAVLSLAIQPSDGKIVVAGSFAASVARLNTNGTLDGAFSLDGGGFNNVAYVVALQPSDEKILVGGPFNSYGGVTRNRMVRLNADGSYDDDFTLGTGFTAEVRAFAIQADNKIIAAGNFSGYAGNSRQKIARLNTDGTHDGTFTPGTNISGNVYALAIQTDGKILAGHQGLTRLNTDGSLDNSLSASFASSPPYFNHINSLSILSDGKILVGGWFAKGLRRINTDGSNDNYITIAAAAGKEAFDGTDLSVNTIAVQSDGKVIVGGKFTQYNGVAVSHITRLTTCASVEIAAAQSAITACEGNNFSFSIDASDGYSYQWQYSSTATGIFQDITNAGIYSGATSKTLNLTGITSGINGYYYRCLVSDGSCTITTFGTTLTVQTVPVINAHPQNTTGCLGSNAQFTVNTSGGSIQWQVNNGEGFADIPSATGTTLTVTNVTAEMAGYMYRARVGSCSPAIYTNSANLTEVIAPPSINALPVINGVCGTNDFSLTVTATGTGLTYQWQYYMGSGNYANLSDGVLAAAGFRLGGTYSGSASATLSIIGITANTFNSTDPASYRVVVTGTGACSANSGPANVYLYATPSISTQPVDAQKCVGTSGNITFSTLINSPSAGLTYRWQVNEGSGFVDIASNSLYTGVTSATLTLTSSNITAAMHGYKYRCIVGSCTPSVISSEATLSVTTPPAITTQPSVATICSGGNATFTIAASGANIIYQWQEQVSGGNFVNVNDDGIYAGTSTATLSLTGISESKNGNRYRCVLNSGVCSSVISNNPLLTVRPLANVTSQPPDRTVCEGGSTTFSVTATNGFGVFQWQVDDGTGFVNVVSGNGITANGSALSIENATTAMNGYKFRCRVGDCATEVFSQTALFTVNATPAIVTSPSNQTICVGGSASFTVSATGSDLSYQWFIGDAMVTNSTLYSGAQTATLTINNAVESLNLSQLSCRVTGATGCSPVQSLLATLTVNHVKIVTQPLNTQPICPGENTQFSLEASGADLTFQWQVNDGSGFVNINNGDNYDGATAATLSVNNVSPTMNNYGYRCVVSGNCTAVTSAERKLTVFPTPPKPIIAVNLSNPEAPQLSVSNGGEEFRWYKDHELLSSSNTINVIEEGLYSVQVKVNGCESEMSDKQAMIITGDLVNTLNDPSWVSIYPNPAERVLYISLRTFRKGEPVSILMTDLLGKSRMASEGIGGETVQLDVSPYPTGKYLLILRQQSMRVTIPFLKSK